MTPAAMTAPGRASLRAGALLVALAAVGCGGDAAASGGAAAQQPPGEELLPVSVARAELKDVPVQLRSVGRVESVASVVLKPQVEGPIVEIGFTEGDEVQAGDVLLRIDDRPFQAELRAAEANLDADTAMAGDALTTLQQLQRVEDLMSEREVQRAQANSAAAAAKVVGDQAEVDLARLRLEWCSIRAPVAGRTGALAVRVGSVVKENETELLTIRQLAPIRVGFSVPEQQLGEIRGQQARAPLAVEAQVASSPAVTGRLSFIDNAVDTSTGTVRLKATFDNEDRALWPGQFVEVQLTLSVEAGAVVVPSRAVQPGQAGTFVFVLTEKGTVEQRPVRVGRAAGGESVIAEGLAGGESVVTEGQLRLSPGSRVSVAP
jgi:multidrug efflux system membrane fusion protein